MSILSYAPNSTQIINDSTDALFDATKNPISIDINVYASNLVAGQKSGNGALFYSKNSSNTWEPSNVKNGSFSYKSGTVYKVLDSSASLTFNTFKNAINETAASEAESDTITITPNGGTAAVYKYYNGNFYNSLNNIVAAPSLNQGALFSINTFVTDTQTLTTDNPYILRGQVGNKVPIDDLLSADISGATNNNFNVLIQEVKPDYDNKFLKHDIPSLVSSEVWTYKNSVYHDTGVKRISVVDFHSDNAAGDKATSVDISNNNGLLTLNIGGTLASDGVGSEEKTGAGLNVSSFASGEFTNETGTGVWKFGTDAAGLKGEIEVTNNDDHPFKLTNINFDAQNDNGVNNPTSLVLKYKSGSAVDAESGGNVVAAMDVSTVDWSIEILDTPSYVSNTGDLSNFWLPADGGNAIFEFEWSGTRASGTGFASVYIDNVQARGQYNELHNTWTVTNPQGSNVPYDAALENTLQNNVLQNPHSGRIGHQNIINWSASNAYANFTVNLNDTEISREALQMNTNGISLLDMNNTDYFSHTDMSFSMPSLNGPLTRYVDIQTGAAPDMEDGAVALNYGGDTAVIGLGKANTQIYDNGVDTGLKSGSGFAYVLNKNAVDGIGLPWTLGGDCITSHVSSNDTSGNYKLNYFVDIVQTGENFGSAVDIGDDGNFIAIGGPGYDSAGLTDNGRCTFLARYGVGVGDISNSSGNMWLNGPYSWRPYAPDIAGASDNDSVGTSVKFGYYNSRVAVAVKGQNCARVYDASYLFTDAHVGNAFNPASGLSYSHGPDSLGNSHPIMWKHRIVDGTETFITEATTILSIEPDGYVKLANGKLFINPVIEWVQKGSDIDLSGCKTIASNSAMNVIVVSNEEYNSGMGIARVYKYLGDDWYIIGSELTGTVQGELLGKSVSVDYEGNFIAIGAPHMGSSAGGASWETESSGNVLVYKIDGTELKQTIANANGVALGDELGWSTVIHSNSNNISDVGVISLAYNGVTNVAKSDNNDPATDGTQFINVFDMVYSAVTPIITTPSLTNDTTPVVTGTGDPGGTINIKKVSDGSVIGTGIVANDGAFSLTLNASELSEGSNSVYAQNLDKSSVAFNIVLDTTAPVVKFTSTGTNVLDISAGTMANSILSLSGDLLDVPGDLVAPGLTSDPSNVDTTTYGDKNVSYYGSDAAGNNVTDTNGNANAVLTFRIVPDFVTPVVTGPAITNSQTPTVVATGTRDVSYVILNDSDISLAEGSVANDGSISAGVSSLSEAVHSIRVRTIYSHQNGSTVINTSDPFSMEIDITAPVLDFSNGTLTQKVFVGEGATFNTKNSSLLNIPTDLLNGLAGLTASVNSIDANTVGTYSVTYSGSDAANNALKDTNNTSPAELTYDVVDINNPTNLSATYDGSCVLVSWDQITETNTANAFNRYEVLTNNANPISVSNNNTQNYAEIPNTTMDVAVTYKVRAVVDGATGEVAGSGTSISITPSALSDDHKRGNSRTNINNFGGSQISLTNGQRRRIFKNLFANNDLSRSDKRVLVDKTSLKFLANKTNYTRIKDDIVVLPPEDANTDVLTVTRRDLANKTLYSALDIDDVLKIRLQGKSQIYKFTQKTDTSLEIKEYADDAALAGDSHTSVVTKYDADEVSIGHANVIFTIGSLIITAGDAPCLTKGTLVKTPSGFKKVEKLSVGEQVITHDGRSVSITGLTRNNIITTETNTPYIIPKDYFGKNMPRSEFTISPNHAISTGSDGNEWFIPAHHGAQLDRVAIGERVCYFHVELPNWLVDNMVINKNIVVESHAEKYHKNLMLTNPLYDELKNGLYRRAYKAYAHQERVVKQIKKDMEAKKKSSRKSC